MLHILFPSETGDSSIPDICFESEFKTALQLGAAHLVAISALMNSDYSKALSKILEFESGAEILWRGWMLPDTIYNGLNATVFNKGGKMLNSTQQYLNCHRACYQTLDNINWLEAIRGCTPKTLLLNSYLSLDEMFEKCFEYFSCQNLFLKDSISSQKYYWKEATFIPNFKQNKDLFKSIVDNFTKKQLEFRGALQDFLVFREFVPLRKIGEHKLGMPYSQEFRSFVYRGKIISTHKYWAEQEYVPDMPPEAWLQELAKVIYQKTENSFFTLDSAQTQANDWIIIEVGDGQVSSIQDSSQTKSIYEALYTS